MSRFAYSNKNMSATTSLTNLGPQQRKKMLSLDSNGSLPLAYPSEPPDDENMNEIVSEDVELEVYLPNGQCKHIAVNYNTPMIDLLVNLAASSKINPGGHLLQVLSSETGKPRDYLPNQPIGSLCVQTPSDSCKRASVVIKPKDKKGANTSAKNVQPFEMTYRFTINLPHQQKKVLRISPSTTLEQLHRQICSDKRLDPQRHFFTLSSNPSQEVDMQRTVGDLGVNEINLNANAIMMDSAKSMPDLSTASRGPPPKKEDFYMPNTGETKKKKGLFSFLKKEKKFNIQSAHYEPEKPSSQAQGPPVRRKSDQALASRPLTLYSPPSASVESSPSRPKSMMVSVDEASSAKPVSSSSINPVKENVPPPRTKKRRAPAPPPSQNPPHKTIQVEINHESQESASKRQTDNEITVEVSSTNQNSKQSSEKFHSRTSSDSSGYHELTLSGAESPDTARLEAVHRRHTHGDSTSLDSGEHMNGDSGIQEISPGRPMNKQRSTIVAMEVGASQTLPLKKVNQKDSERSRSLERDGKKKAPPRKKKAAPLPPSEKLEKTSENSPTPPPNTSSAPAPDLTLPSADNASEDEPSPFSCVPFKTQADKRVHDDDIDDVDDEVDEQDIAAVLEGLDRDLATPRGHEELPQMTMMMIENDSLQSEDIDIDLDVPKVQRPCAFIAPPPPSEPPPEDVEPVSFHDVMGVDMVDVGVETSDSCGPDSTRSSPLSMHSRPESRTSISSLNTIEDVNMAFQLTIAAGEQAMLDDDDQNISTEKTSQQAEATADISNTDQEVSEITYSFALNTAPPGFQSDPVNVEELRLDLSKDDEGEEEVEEKEEEDDDEEEVVETTEIIYPFRTSNSYSSPAEPVISEDSHQHSQPSFNGRESPVHQATLITLKAEPTVTIKQVSPPPEEKEEPVYSAPVAPPVPKPKDNIVFDLDDLDNVDFFGGGVSTPRSTLVTEVQPSKTENSMVDDLPETSEVIVNNSYNKVTYFNEENDGFSNPVIDLSAITPEEESKEYDAKGIKDRCSELSFSPSSEGEEEHMLEEKSISMIILPAMRSKSDDHRNKNPEAKKNIFADNTEIEAESVSSTQMAAPMQTDNNDSLSAESLSTEEQSNQIQQQLDMWREQLAQNQKLLASSESVPGDENSLQQQLKAQLEIQKKMMEQMEQSLQTLNLQKQTSSLKSEPDLPLEEVPHTTIIPQPPPAPEVPKAVNGKVSSGVKVQEKSGPVAPAKSKGKSKRVIDPPKLDPREELMIAIRSAGGMTALKKVPVNKTKWHTTPLGH